jgi:hypothetical protein
MLVILVAINLVICEQGAKYLIISNDMFCSTIQPLADWKTKKGIKAKVVPLSVIGNNPTLIKNYIYNAYYNWDIRPEYVLLVGSGIRLPAIGNSDDYYVDLTGTGNPLIELSVGRFPCIYPRQCSTMVAKALRFERLPSLISDTTWYLKGTTIVDNDWAADTIYWENCRYIHNFWQNNQYLHIDSFSTLNGDSTDDVVNAINDGRAFVTYRGLATVNWWHFAMNPELTNNGSKLPIIVSGTCATMSLSDTSYLGNKCLSAGNSFNFKGAVGFFGTTIATSGTGLATLRGTVFKGFFRSVFQDNVYKLGDAAKRAKFILDSIRPLNYTDMRYKEWNLFGDPELPLYTCVPKPLTVIHDTIILTGPQNYTITVSQFGNPVSNALVCVMMDSIIYQYGYTNSAGIISFIIYSPYPGLMSVTVTTRNSIAYEKNVNILPGGNIHDISLFLIIEPQGQVGAGSIVYPKALIKNWGGYTDTFAVTFKIGDVYNYVISSVSVGAGDTFTVSFPPWNAVIGDYSVSAFITFGEDQWHANDTAHTSINVIAPNDVGVESILNPDTLQTLNKVIIPRVKIKNFGSLQQINFSAVCSIFGMSRILRYANIKTISLAAGRDTIVNFAPWTPALIETCTVKITSLLAGDENPLNNTKIRLTIIIEDYLENFEDGNGYYVTNPLIGSWAWGKVNFGPYAAHSGIKC